MVVIPPVSTHSYSSTRTCTHLGHKSAHQELRSERYQSDDGARKKEVEHTLDDWQANGEGRRELVNDRPARRGYC